MRIQKLRQLALAACVAVLSASTYAQTFWTQPDRINSYAAVDDISEHDIKPKIAADEHGNLVAVWQVAWEYTPFDLYSTRIRSAFSADQGQTWSTPHEFPGDHGLYDRKEYSTVSYAGNGRWVTLWQGDDALTISTSADGKTWSAPQIISPDIWDYRVAADEQGNVVVFIRKINTTFTTILRSSDAGQSWQESGILAQQVNKDHSQLHYAGEGKWYFIHVESNMVQVLRSTDIGESWNVTGEFAGAWLPASAAAGDTILAVTGEGLGTYGLVTHLSTDGGATFTTSTKLNSLLNWKAELARNSTGHWMLFTETEYEINYTRVDGYQSADGIHWTHVLEVQQDEAQNGDPDVVGSADGSFIAAWNYFDGNAPPTDRDADVIVSTSDDNGETWGPFDYLNQNALVDSTNIQDKSPKITGAGNAVVASWTIFADDQYNPDASEQSLVTATSMDGGDTWSTMVVAAQDVGRGHNLNPVYNGDGNWLLPWRRFSSYGVLSGELGYVVTSDNGTTLSEPKVVHGLVVASNGAGTLLSANADRILRSTDNGQTWQNGASFNGTGSAFLVHVSGSDWVLAYEGGSILRIGNDGDNITTLQNASSVSMPLTDLKSNAAGHLVATGAVAVGATMEIYTSYSTDGGQTWSERQLVHIAQRGSVPAYNYGSSVKVKPEVFPLDDNQWMFVSNERTQYTGAFLGGPFYAASSLWTAYSSDGGATWTPAEKSLLLPVHNEQSMVGLDPPDFAVAGNQVIVADARRIALAGDEPADFDIYMHKTTEKPEVPAGPPTTEPPAPPVTGPPSTPPSGPPGVPPPPGVEPPTVVEPVGPNLSGVWAPAEAKYKTNKKGVFKGSIKATFAMGNNGTEKTEQKSVVRFYLSPDPVLGFDDVELKPKNIGKVKPGKGKSAKVKINKLEAPVTGQYLFAIVDADMTVPESSEADNIIMSAPLP